jgi:lysine-specific demethylase 6A
MQTIQHSIHIQEFVKSKGIEIKFHGRNKNEASHYCGQCEVSDLYHIHAHKQRTNKYWEYLLTFHRRKFSTFFL